MSTAKEQSACEGTGARLTVSPVVPPDGVGAAYVRVPMRVTAFQWDGELCLPGWLVNPSDARVELRFEGTEHITELAAHTALIPCNDYVNTVNVGDWVVIGRLGDMHVYEDELFRALYVAIPEDALAADADGGPAGK